MPDIVPSNSSKSWHLLSTFSEPLKMLNKYQLLLLLEASNCIRGLALQ